MAAALSAIYVPCFSTDTNLSSKIQMLRRNANCKVRFRSLPKALFQKNFTTSLKSPPEEPKSSASSEQVRRDKPAKSSNSLLSAPVSVPLLNRVRYAFTEEVELISLRNLVLPYLMKSSNIATGLDISRYFHF